MKGSQIENMNSWTGLALLRLVLGLVCLASALMDVLGAVFSSIGTALLTSLLAVVPLGIGLIGVTSRREIFPLLSSLGSFTMIAFVVRTSIRPLLAGNLSQSFVAEPWGAFFFLANLLNFAVALVAIKSLHSPR